MARRRYLGSALRIRTAKNLSVSRQSSNPVVGNDECSRFCADDSSRERSIASNRSPRVPLIFEPYGTITDLVITEPVQPVQGLKVVITFRTHEQSQTRRRWSVWDDASTGRHQLDNAESNYWRLERTRPTTAPPFKERY
jgi:hypothetical protein